MHTTVSFFASLIVIAVGVALYLHHRRRVLTAGTVPGSFPPESNMVPGQIAVANKLGATAAFGSVNFFTAPVAGYYQLSWAVHIENTDGAGTVTFTVTPQGAPAIPGVQANLATPVDGHGPAATYYLPAGGTVNGAMTVGSLGTTSVDCWVFAQRMA